MESDDTTDSLDSWRAFARSVPDQVFRLDRTGRILFVNRVVSPLTVDEVVGTNWLEWVPPEQRDRLDAELAAVLAEGRERSYELEAIGPDHTRAVYASHLGAIVERGEVVGAVLSARDVTRDRLDSIGTLAAGIAHEINNPLACVAVNLAYLDDHLREATPDIKQVVTEAREAATRVQHVLRDLMVFARGNDTPSTSADTGEILASTLRLCASETRYRARVVTRFDALPAVAASASQLGDVFMTLVLAAARSIPMGTPDAHELRVVAMRRGAAHAAVEISTTSPPIAEPHELAIARRIVGALGGELDVRGSIVTVVIPLAPASAASPAAPEVAPSTSPRRGRVLVIDDEPLLAKAVARILGADHDVTIADRADEVLGWLATGQRFDAIVCDLMMPHMTGMEFHAAVAARDPVAADRIIFLSGGAFTPAAREFLARIPNTSFAKPFDLDALASAVDERVAT